MNNILQRLCAILASLAIAVPAAGQPAAVTIRRDAFGVPHVFARTTYGLFYGFGYALAEDQLLQLELLKRTARGTLAAVLGPQQLDNDRTTRSRYDIAALETQYRRLPNGDKDIFRGMAAGINARIRTALAMRANALPKGFIDAGFLPEPWSAVDVIAVYEHSMVLRFSDLNSEIDNLALLTRLRAGGGPEVGGRQFDALRPVDDPAAPTTIAAQDAPAIPPPAHVPPVPSGRALPNGLVGLADAVRFGARGASAATLARTAIPHASNAWLAGPKRTGDGSAILVNGPQMGDFAATYIWAIGLHGAGFNVVGSAPVGSPWLIFGTNGRIGWGATAGLGDTTDIYQELLDPADPHRYRFRDAWHMMARRDETILVKGGAAQPLTIWSTIHGPVELFDQGAHRAYARRRSWAGLEVASLVAWVHAMQASDYVGWRAQVSKVAISVNNYYADARGNIGYQFLGRFPLRPAGQDARMPATGDGSMEWVGFVPGEQNPHVLNPIGGSIANWNNRPQPGYPSSDFMPWTRVDRQNELADALAAAPRLDRKPIWDVVRRLSFVDVNARYFRAVIAGASADGDAGAAARLLAGWDGEIADPVQRAATPQYLIFRAFLQSLLPALYTPLLPAAGSPARAAAERDFLLFDPVFPSLGVKGAVAALSDPRGGALLIGRDKKQMVAGALAAAWRASTSRYGPDPARWFEAAKPHLFASTSYAGVAQSDPSAAYQLPVFMNRGTENDRIVFRGGQVDYCDVTPPGQSGFVAPDGTASAHAADQLQLYAAFDCKQQWLAPADVVRHTTETHRLLP